MARLMERQQSIFMVPRERQDLVRQLGLTHIESIFSDPRIVPWRSIPERENCTLDATREDGSSIRLHVKRYKPVRTRRSPAEDEADGIAALEFAQIPTVPLIAWGYTTDGRSFLITEDLAGFQDAEKAVQAGLPFDRILNPTADLAAKLHDANLHHRDLYLCHFFVRVSTYDVETRLIDPARVAYLPSWPFRNRWVVKDLAQFRYSLSQLDIEEALRDRWLKWYAMRRRFSDPVRLRDAVQRKSDTIARHDAKLREKQPTRNVSIPR